MTDAITALEQLTARVSNLGMIVVGSRGKSIPPERVRRLVKSIAVSYFASVRDPVVSADESGKLVAELDRVIRNLIQLPNAVREKTAYVGQLNELKQHLEDATIAVMLSRGTPTLVLSQTEKGILTTLDKMLPNSARSYEQVLRDISHGSRVSWRGTAAELREVLREVMDHLAPDDKVMAAPGFQLEGDLRRPTQMQKIRFILKARNARSGATATATAALQTVEETIATLARSTYQRGSGVAHSSADGSEVRKFKGYVDALLAELLFP